MTHTLNKRARGHGGGMGGGNVGLQPGAVHFDGATALTMNTGINVADSPLGMMSVWMGHAFYGGDDNNLSIVTSDPTNFCFNPIIRQSHNDFEGILKSAAGANTVVYTSSIGSGPFETGWKHYLTAWDTTLADPGKIIRLFINRQSDLLYTPGAVPGFSVAYSDGDAELPGFCVGAAATPGVEEYFCGDMFDLMLWVGIAPDISDVNVLNKFITTDLRPVNPNIAIATFGQPALFCGGDKSHFARNVGTGGALVPLAGSLSNAPSTPYG